MPLSEAMAVTETPVWAQYAKADEARRKHDVGIAVRLDNVVKAIVVLAKSMRSR